MTNKVNGNIAGIKSTMLERIRSIYDLTLGQDEFASAELIELLCLCSQEINREISVYISRDGRIADVSVGDNTTVAMPTMRLVRNEDRLSGVRCIHTHPSGSGMLSGVDLGTLRTAKLDSMAAVGVSDGRPTQLYAAFLGDGKDDSGRSEALIYGPFDPMRLPQKALMLELYRCDDSLRSTVKAVDAFGPERTVLVGMDGGEGYDTLEELAELARTAGANVVGRMRVRRRTADNSTYIGSGKADELSRMGSELQAELFIFDDELSAIQLRSLEDILGARVIDRTTLILDIFAERASSREGKLQVELAQMRYRLPRLLGQGRALSRLGGGIGTRGPGEKRLEIDRRRIHRRIYELENELSEIAGQRELRREGRRANRLPTVALVGYTNAGKSTLLNSLTGAGVLAEDMLFATLDPVVRQITLPGGTEALISDTVGFINKLPHDLVEAFRSTLEEVSNADLILHVADLSSPYHEKQMQVVAEVLDSLNASDIPLIKVYNKADLLSAERPTADVSESLNAASDIKGSDDRLTVSALNGSGISELLALIEKKLNASRRELELVVPYSKYEAAAFIRSHGMLLFEEHLENGTHIKALLDDASMGQLKKMLDL